MQLCLAPISLPSTPRYVAAEIFAAWNWSLNLRIAAQAPPPGNAPSYLPSVPSGAPNTAPVPRQNSLSRRTVDTYTNQPTHYYSTSSSQPVSQFEDAPAETMPPAPAPYTEGLPPSAPAAPAPAAVASTSNGGIPDFDELTARFERLRKRQDRHDQDNASFTF
ncbi:unnamed protein product [Phytophthora fragariaefolia]|uniref:Unnamed protein product n=1 Tax=Phytophthora fragariaefolia TaxID=1490495 RepID=A0A9W7DBY6_9STRA|nr:unnamed protein product [Phytophthora fragariaefolia]